jgi:SAM-dependent methyltransferase
MEAKLYQEMYEIEGQHWWFRARRDILISLISKYIPYGNILDVGCGTGFILETLQKNESKYKVWGVDVSEIAIQFCQERGLTHVTQGRLENNDLPKHYFDLMMFLDMIEHLEQDLPSLLQAKQYLNSQGKILITVPAYQFLWSAHDEIHHHKRRYTKKQITELLHQAGYEVIFSSYFNTFLFPLIAIARLIGNLQNRHHSSDVNLPSRWINQILYQIFGWEKKLLPSLSFPFGVSIICLARKH